MRFSEKRYYIESYVKCANCGVLVYDAGVQAHATDGAPRLYCSDWCRDWAAQREAGQKPVLPLPRSVRHE
jgi:5-oxoprolinase (ATP-hydrolysing)/N-methylhydantoinase B